MHIKSLILNNFQSHENTVLSFDPGFNIIVGSSDVGKSSIVRALKFILFDYWDKNYIRTNHQVTRVFIKFFDNIEITRIKGKNINELIIKDDKDIQKYSHFGLKLPKNIINKLKNYDFIIDLDKRINLNIASQHDPLFLINESGFFKAKLIGNLAGIYLFDIAIQDLNSDLKRLNIEIIDIKNKIDELRQRLEKYNILSELLQTQEELQNKFSKVIELENNIKNIEQLLNDINIYNREFENYKIRKNILKDIDLNKITKEYYDNLLKFKICPICGNQLQKDRIKIYV